MLKERERKKFDKKELLLYVDVNIAPGKTGRIGIHKDDDPYLLADNFSKIYQLNDNMTDTLVNMLKYYIDKHYENSPE